MFSMQDLSETPIICRAIKTTFFAGIMEECIEKNPDLKTNFGKYMNVIYV